MEPRESLEAPGNSPLEEMWDKEWKENLIEAAIERVKRQVKEEHFQMFDLYVTKKWSVGAVAQTFGVNPGQVYLAKHRIGSLIRKEVRRLEKDLV
jgi:RNA polymerase sigma-70 factor (ECF subfamily)